MKTNKNEYWDELIVGVKKQKRVRWMTEVVKMAIGLIVVSLLVIIIF